MFDAFYFGNKPGVLPHERYAANEEEARELSRTRCLWIIDEFTDYSAFDFLWEPAPWEIHQRHAIRSQHQRASGTFLIPKWGWEDTNYRKDLVVCKKENTNWKIPPDIDTSSFDFSWHPDSTDEPFIYQFGTQWQRTGGPRYIVPGATQVKFVSDQRAIALPNNNWEVPDTINAEEFDFSWHPDATDEPFIYQFGTQWQRTGGPRYIVPGATQVKFVTDMRVTHSNSTPKYYIETTLDDLIDAHPTEIFWALNNEMSYDDFDFSWHPDVDQQEYLHVFGSRWQKHSQTYYVNAPVYLKGKKELNFVSDLTVESNTKLSIFFIDQFNPEADARFAKLQQRHPHAEKTRFIQDWMSTIARLCKKTKTDKFWVISSELNYDDFDFSWHPEPWQQSMTHVFPTKWQKWSNTFLINRWEFEHHATWCKNIEDLPKLNFVEGQVVDVPPDVTDIYIVDHGNKETPELLSTLSARYKVVKTTRFFDSYLETLRRIVRNITDKEYIWVIGSVCDYSKFDFSWQPEPWQKEMLHVFPSGDQKFGDTFYVNVQSLRNQIEQIELLDWFETIHYCQDQTVPRCMLPVVDHNGDSIVAKLKTADFNGPLVLVADRYVKQKEMPVVSLWAEKKRTVMPLSKSGSVAIVPRQAIGALKDQVYDYPHVAKNVSYLVDKPLDIVYISNGESVAERNWEWLNDNLASKANKIHRVDSVKGRVAAYQAAANASTTPWFFAVFAKLQVEPSFDWEWQADRLQQAKHYIFYAENPVNGLVYGHQAMIAYHKGLCLVNEGKGLDFTLDQPHEVVPELSGVALYNTDAWTAWRTAFRETLKLRQMTETSVDYAVASRLKAWQAVGKGDNAEWSQRGALDAIDYYESVGGEHTALHKSYEWEWLRAFYEQKYR